MNAKRFVGVAYWSLSTGVSDWLTKAIDVLAPIESAGLAVLAYDCLPVGNQLTVTFNDEPHPMFVNEGQGRGVVRPSASAAMFVVCLVALRKALGDISVVTDSRENVPTKPRPSYPLYAENWECVLPVAEKLGLVVGEAFNARHQTLLNNVF